VTAGRGTPSCGHRHERGPHPDSWSSERRAAFPPDPAQACAIIATILAGVIAGLIAASWIWAIASAVVIYAASQAAVMAWAAWWMITRRRRLDVDEWGDFPP
jgi:hypothetical protein